MPETTSAVVPEVTSDPFLDEVLYQVALAIRIGSALPIPDDLLKNLMSKYRVFFKRQLPGTNPANDRKKWHDESKNVLLAATTLGEFATGIARLHHLTEVDKNSLRAAAAIVEQECHGEYGAQGCWCDYC